MPLRQNQDRARRRPANHEGSAMTKTTSTRPAITASIDTLALRASMPSTEHGVGRGVMTAPAAWYSRPEADGPTRLTITDDGQVYGHIAPWGASHRGTGVNSDIVRGDDYSQFHTGRVATTEGAIIDIGHLTIGGGHAPETATAQAAAEHYDNVATVWAHVRAINGEHGIWVSGSVAPGVTDLMLHKAQAFPPSGDWRWIDGQYRMVACCEVVTPGFPVQEMRAQVASGQPGRLVASIDDWTGVTAAGDLPDLGGPTFELVIFPEGELSRDGRSIDPGATRWSDQPMPLYHKLREEHGGMETEGTVMVGRIDKVWRDAKSVVRASGQFLDTDEAVEAAQLVDQRVLTGVSGDLGEMKGTYLGAEIELWIEPEDSDGNPDTPETITIPDEPFDSAEPWMTVQDAELIGATLCGKPAFANASVMLTSALGADVAPLPVAAASYRRRERIQPFRVVGRPKPASTPTLEQRLAAAEASIADLRGHVASLTAALRGPAAVAAALEPEAREKVRGRLAG